MCKDVTWATWRSNDSLQISHNGLFLSTTDSKWLCAGKRLHSYSYNSSVTKTNCLHSHNYVLRSPSAPPLMLLRLFKYHRILSMCIFSHRAASHARSLPRKKLTGCQLKQKANWQDGFQFVSAVPQRDLRPCVNVWVVGMGEGVNCSCTPPRCDPVSVSVRAGRAAPSEVAHLIDQSHVCLTVPLGAIWHSPLIFPLSLPIHLIFVPCQYPPLSPTLCCVLRRLI